MRIKMLGNTWAIGRLWVVWGSCPGMWQLDRDDESIYLWEVYTPIVRVTWLRRRYERVVCDCASCQGRKAGEC